MYIPNYMYICIYTHTYIYIYVVIHIYVYIYMFAHCQMPIARQPSPPITRNPPTSRMALWPDLAQSVQITIRAVYAASACWSGGSQRPINIYIHIYTYICIHLNMCIWMCRCLYVVLCLWHGVYLDTGHEKEFMPPMRRLGLRA